MNKSTFLFCFFLSCIHFTTAQIVNIPDANFKNALVNTNCADFVGDIFSDPTGDVDTNNDGEIQVSEALAVKGLFVNNKQIGSMAGIEAFTNLIKLFCRHNQLTTLGLEGLNDMIYFHCQNNQLTDLNISGLDNLNGFNCDFNQLTNINVSDYPNFTWISCQNNDLTTLNISGVNKLEQIYCSNNEISNLAISVDMVNLEHLSCRNNQLTYLQIPSFPLLKTISCSYNPMNFLSISSQLPSLEYLDCENTGLTFLDAMNYSNLTFLSCRDNFLTTLNVQNCFKLETLWCSGNQLESLFIKNGSLENLSFEDNWNPSTFMPTLNYICCDDFQKLEIENLVDQYNYPNVTINSLCTFTPGGLHFPVQGQTTMDLDMNGCDTNDSLVPNLKFSIQDATGATQFIADGSGYYAIPLLAGAHTISPILSSNYFTISPNSLSVDFPNDPFPFVQDYCLEPSGIFHDLKISIIPITPARPGFDALYKIVYKNQGTQIESGSLNFNFDNNRMSLVFSNVTPNNQNGGDLSWNFANLAPFESNTITVKLNVNSPIATPPVNIGDVLGLTADIQGNQADETPNDNHFTLNQSVIGAFDPNDKTCLEGNVITPEMVGDFVHYLIRFENTGNYHAENIVVRDLINTNTFEINTLEITDTSHEVSTRIVNGNQVEFIFENIQLPFDDANNKGYVVFKIKTVSTLEIGDLLENQAEIYFDFNPPIITNQTQSIIDYPDFDQDGFNNLSDCNDYDANINPNQNEIPYNGIDDDCNTTTLDDDLDKDGFLIVDDCDDNNPDINPNQNEIPYNGIDDDCNATTSDDDLDEDGFLIVDDCDDNNPNINPNQNEIPYNGIDDDCNATTSDDDLDEDGFLIVDDCDDNNPNINPNQNEIPYNGIDDDCNATTLDDDLDEDGFLIVDDCDDNNPDINPTAMETPNNGIDEDCDGTDLMTSTRKIDNSSINIFPNPVTSILYIQQDANLQFEIQLFNSRGKLILKNQNIDKIFVQHLPAGTYILELRDLNSNQKVIEKIIVEN